MTHFTTTKPTWEDKVAGFGFVQNFAGQPPDCLMRYACSLRAVTIATGLPYNDVWRRHRGGYDPYHGTCPDSTARMLKQIGWSFVSLGETGKPLDKIKINWQDNYVFWLTGRHLTAVVAGDFQDIRECRCRRIGKWVRQSDGMLQYQPRYFYSKVIGYWHHAN